MLRETLVTNIKRIIDFLIYSRNFLIRKSPIKALINSIVEERFLDNEKEIKDGSVQIELSQTPVSKNGTVDCRK